MENNIENKLLDKFKLNIAISNFEEEYKNNTNKRNTLYSRKNWRYIMKKRIITTACASIVLVSGVVCATNIENIKNYFVGLDYGIRTAAENGYIANPKMDYVKSDVEIENEGIILDDISTEVKIEDFMMDDLNLNVEFGFIFDKNIKEVFDLDNLRNINLDDLIVQDEENRIIYNGENGLMCFPSYHNKENNSVGLTYNMYSDSYPKSKKLYFTFNKIKLIEKDIQNTVTLKGSWQIQVDVPENMYNRTSENYRVVSCDNENFEVYSSKVTDTGFEIGVIISDIKREKSPFTYQELYEKTEKYNKEFEEGTLSKEAIEFMDKYNEYQLKNNPIQVTSYSGIGTREKAVTPSYVENDNGKNFESTLSPSRRAKTEWLDGDKYNFYETFGMTKYESTNKIKVILYYYGNPVTIELEKIK